MAAKKSGKKNDKAADVTGKRNAILREDLLAQHLGEFDLRLDGTPEEMADRLEKKFLSEHSLDELVKCHPGDCTESACKPPRSETDVGCHYLAPSTIPYCPFCGQSEDGEVAAEHEKLKTPRLAPAPSVKFSSADLRHKKKPDVGAESQGSTSAIVVESDADKLAFKARTGALTAADEAVTLPAEGRTAADLDREVKRIKDAIRLREETNTRTFWEEGDALRTINRDKLWCALRREEDGAPVFKSFGHFAAEEFGYSPGHAWALVEIVERVPVDAALKVGVAKAKIVAYAPEEHRAALLTKAETATLKELEAEVKLLSAPVLPPAPSSANDAPSFVLHDEDGVVLEEGDDERHRVVPVEEDDQAPSSSRPNAPKTITITLVDEKLVIPLYVDGSSVKPAKKLADGAHGSATTLNGMKLGVVLRVGDEGRIEIELSARRPG